MIKIILTTLFGVFLLVITGIIFYWRDIKHDPSRQDFLIFFGLIPLSITFLILMPMLIKKIYERHQEKKKQKNAEAEQASETQIAAEKQESDQIDWVQLQVFSVTSLSGIAENEAHIELLQNPISPQLDQQLFNHFNLPTTSFRIAEIDNAVNNDAELAIFSPRRKRIVALIQQQLEQNIDVLSQIAAHLKNSALFYDVKLAHEYRMHPAWMNPNSEHQDEEIEQKVVESVPRLNRLNIHIILAENLLHFWDEDSPSAMVNEFLTGLGIIPQHLDTQYHYWGKSAYKDWIQLLKQIQYLDSEVSFFIVVDSEIDSETIADVAWGFEKYIPSEYASTCCITSTNVELQNLVAIKNIRIALNADQAVKTLKGLSLEKAPQFTQDEPFVLILDDPTEAKLAKKLKLNFAESMIEEQHYLYSVSCLGQTQTLSKIFGFMLGLHFKDELYSYVYSAEHQQTQVIVGTEFA